MIVITNNLEYTADMLYQWDENQVLEFSMETLVAPLVHFCNVASDKAIVVQSEGNAEDGFKATIPNVLLTEPHDIIAYLYSYRENVKGNTLLQITIPVTPRVEPDDYVFTENVELTTLAEISQMVLDKASKSELASTTTKIRNELTTQIEIERARIDGFKALASGSTTGDAELLDIRVEYDGSVGTTAGNAVREQYKKLSDRLDRIVAYLNNLTNDNGISIVLETSSGAVLETSTGDELEGKILLI